ncbi:Y-family DNA polymerase [Arthrobacter ulcerisalmonis]|uniref:Y-family DNA polymerase n=1 Tax=Arthrobacter ulcerisalmonis TaxID=2483813 RepID=UPI003629D9D5
MYSIDEAFVSLPGSTTEQTAAGRQIRAGVRRNVGLPVCVGLASTKTLAKLANQWAKNNPQFQGVCHWDAASPRTGSGCCGIFPHRRSGALAGATAPSWQE